MCQCIGRIGYRYECQCVHTTVCDHEYWLKKNVQYVVIVDDGVRKQACGLSTMMDMKQMHHERWRRDTIATVMMIKVKCWLKGLDVTWRVILACVWRANTREGTTTHTQKTKFTLTCVMRTMSSVLAHRDWHCRLDRSWSWLSYWEKKIKKMWKASERWEKERRKGSG